MEAGAGGPLSPVPLSHRPEGPLEALVWGPEVPGFADRVSYQPRAPAVWEKGCEEEPRDPGESGGRAHRVQTLLDPSALSCHPWREQRGLWSPRVGTF